MRACGSPNEEQPSDTASDDRWGAEPDSATMAPGWLAEVGLYEILKPHVRVWSPSASVWGTGEPARQGKIAVPSSIDSRNVTSCARWPGSLTK